jgi:hypothetical protein
MTYNRAHNFCILITALFALLFFAGCSEDFFSPGEKTDQADESPVDEGEGSALPWDTDDPYPVIAFSNPEPGDFASTQSIVAAGSVTGVVPDSFTINKNPVDLGAGGSFSKSTYCNSIGPLLPVLGQAKTPQFTSNERVIAILGESIHEDDPIEKAFSINGTDGLLALINELVTDTVLGFDFSPILDQLNPVLDILGATLEVTHITIADMDMTLALVDEGLLIDNLINDLSIGLHLNMDLLGLPLTADGTADVDAITFSSLSVVETDPQSGPQLVLQNVSTELSGFALHYENVPDWLFMLMNTATREVVEWIVDFLFTTVVPGIINGVLDALQFEIALDTLTASLDFDQFAIDSAGLRAVFQSNLTATQVAPNVPVKSRSLHTPGELPTFSQTTPDGKSYDLALAIDDDVINRGFFSMTKAGLFSFELDSPVTLNSGRKIYLTAGAIAGLFPSLENIDPQMPVRIRLVPGAPPVLSPHADQDKMMHLGLVGYTLYVDLQTGSDNAGMWEAFSISFDIAAEAGLDVDDQGGVALDLAVPTINAQVVHNRIGEEQALLIQGALGLLDTVLDDILGTLSSVRITLPAFFGYKIVPVEVLAEGASGDILTIYVRFEKE